MFQEERKRTGRYVAAGTAIFLSLLGVYQALARGTPEYAALFAPALIMFIYVFWILYASKHYKRNCLIGSDVSGDNMVVVYRRIFGTLSYVFSGFNAEFVRFLQGRVPGGNDSINSVIFGSTTGKIGVNGYNCDVHAFPISKREQNWEAA